MEEYNYGVEYVPGKCNVKVDALSRNSNASEFELADHFDDKMCDFTHGKGKLQVSVISRTSVGCCNFNCNGRYKKNDRKPVKGRLKGVYKQLRNNFSLRWIPLT